MKLVDNIAKELNIFEQWRAVKHAYYKYKIAKYEYKIAGLFATTPSKAKGEQSKEKP